ncbi:hypothetical protein AB0I06_34285 [Streptomyces sp. NPDC050674]|uniref:hypothetical protein n=1 Tax=Streptomyces sp. NPDC050674 TaxID=3157216 RepID=UPI003431D8FA
MSQPTARKPHDHALWLINNVDEGVNGMCTLPDGRVRDLPGPLAVGILTVRSNLAIASELVAVAEALRGEQ